MALVIRAPYPDAGGGMRLWTPNDLGSAVSLWVDTQDASSYDLDTDSKATAWRSKVGSGILVPGSGRPRKLTVNSMTAFAGGLDFAYFRANIAALPAGTSDATMLFIGYSYGNYNPTISLQPDRQIGTANNANKVGITRGGNDLDTDVTYSANGNIVIAEWVAATPKSSLWVDGSFASTRTIAASGSGSGMIQALGNTTATGDAVLAIIVVNRVLTADERARLEGWSAWNFNYVARLPAGHAYKSAPPMVPA